MATYKIQQNQTGLDIVNQLYTSQNNIYDIYLNNADFNINLMQYDLQVNYTNPINQTVNIINNNNYIFKNGNVSIFTELCTITSGIGIFNTPEIILYSNIIPSLQINNTNTEEYFIFEQDDDIELKLYESENILKIAADLTPDNIIYQSLDFNGSEAITNIALNPINVSGNFYLFMENMPNLTNYNFLENITIVDTGEASQVINIDASRTLLSSGNMNLFLETLVNSSMSDVISGGLLSLSIDDVEPSGSDWTTLVSNGWSYSIV